MRHLLLTIVLVLCLVQNITSQDKVLKGDTVFWNNRHQKDIEKLGLMDFNKTQADFAFRFWNYGQVVEVVKDKDQIQCELTNYIYHTVHKRAETLFEKIRLDSVQSLNVYKIILALEIESLPTDKEIKGWSQGRDGITYIIEHTDKTDYWFKNYWTPSSQDSIPESVVLMDFIKQLSDTLQLPEQYKKFREGLPKRGCYGSGGSGRTCYESNSYGLGYWGSTRLPLGFISSVYLTYIGSIQSDVGFLLQYMSDGYGRYFLEAGAQKRKLFLANSKMSDFLQYGYQNRKPDYIDANTTIRNHRLSYGLSMKDLQFSAGVNFWKDVEDKTGGFFSVSKGFKPQISTSLSASVFEDDIDYVIGISKSFFFNRRFVIRGINIGLNFENFKDHNDLNMSLLFWL